MRHSRTTATLCACGLALLAGCAEEPAVEETIRPVRYEVVRSPGEARIREYAGVAEAGIRSRLSFKVGGTVNALPARVGDVVQSGEMLARLDPSDFEIRVQEALASLAQANAQERRARADYQRAQELWENNNLSRAELDAAQAAAESARATVRAAEQNLALARRQLGYTRLTAPVAGAISSVPVELNENVSAGQTIAEITSGARLEVRVGLPEVLIAEVSEGDRVDVAFDAIPDTRFGAIVTEVGVAPTPGASTFPVAVRLEREDPRIRVGMAATVAFRFASPAEREQVEVPYVAVGEDREGRFVFVVVPDTAGLATVLRRRVAIGDPTVEGIEILEGLEPGELVVTAGVRRLQDGQRVRLLGEAGG